MVASRKNMTTVMTTQHLVTGCLAGTSASGSGSSPEERRGSRPVAGAYGDGRRPRPPRPRLTTLSIEALSDRSAHRPPRCVASTSRPSSGCSRRGLPASSGSLHRLYRSTDRLSRRGAPMKNLAHSASFRSREKCTIKAWDQTFSGAAQPGGRRTAFAGRVVAVEAPVNDKRAGPGRGAVYH